MPTLVIEGIELSELEQKLLVVIWQGNGVGVCPSPESEALAQFGPDVPATLEGLSKAGKGLIYLAHAEEEPSYRGYCFTTLGQKIADQVFDLGGYKLGDCMPPRPEHSTPVGTKTNPGRFDCYANAEPDEPLFVLLARDKHAPALVWLWAVLRELEGEDAETVKEARERVVEMVAWAADHGRQTCGIGVSVLAGVMELIRGANAAAAQGAKNVPTRDDFFRLVLGFTPLQESAPPPLAEESAPTPR